MDNNSVFKARYNVLDNYCKRLAGIDDNKSGIFLLEQVVDIERASYLKTIRSFKNTIVSHNGIDEEPIAPNKYINFINSEIEYIKRNESSMKIKLQNAAKNKNANKSSKKEKQKKKEPKKYWLADQIIKSSNSSNSNYRGEHSPYYCLASDVRRCLGHRPNKSMDDLKRAALSALTDFYNQMGCGEFAYDLFPNSKYPKVTIFNKKRFLEEAALRWVNSLHDWEIRDLLNG